MLSKREKFKDLTDALDHAFSNPELLSQAFRHASYVNEQTDASMEDNERLEFLGDAVLDLAISHMLMVRFPHASEGILSKYRAAVVDEAGLYQVARNLNLGAYLVLGKGEEQSRGREKPSILANTVEALLGAVYLDAGYHKTLEIIEKLFSSLLERVGTEDMVHDYKSLLQEYTQQAFKTLPAYHLVKESGPAHDKTFGIELSLDGKILSTGDGKSKKEAEQKAARKAFLCLREDLNR